MHTESQTRRFTRRQLIGASVAAGLGGFLALEAGARPARANTARNHHLAWVWQFSTDSEPHEVGARLRDHGLGILLKTHDGVTWMSEYDKSRYAVSGPAQLTVLANYFESAGVPFHGWCVVHGRDPVREAQMAAAVLHSGARSIFLDVEPHTGFWRGTPQDAIRFGQELRRLAPEGEVHLSVDPRPWVRDAIPLREFTAFVNSIAPQQYWRTFDTRANHDRYAASGFPVPPGGVTPEFLLSTTMALYGEFGLPIHHTGQGSQTDASEWHRFIDNALALGSEYVSVWRLGVTPPDVLAVLRDKPALQPAAPVAVQHIVQPGETLGLLAGHYGTTVAAIAEANGISDPNYIFVGQQLTIPTAGGATAVAFGGPAATAGTAAPAPSGGGSRSYTVVSGDTLYGIAGRFGTTVSAIADANGLADPNFIRVGQELLIV